ncbi:hypothetical protein HAZT_HAZT009496 [Hyalella azteca]|uniref:Uncharacterized protein n=1 Tax=Hyalella azteca TaxID=294128 RepID=A0A6A0GST6_HYAAZ|nr:hypothetical protein HAZT_HAZT009496 [Hyalella azteca]
MTRSPNLRLRTNMSAQPAQVSQVTVNMNAVNMTETHLAPGVCTVCRRGKIENSASCCTWVMCLLLLPLGIIPGIIAFCCCCRKPKCTSCGYTV